MGLRERKELAECCFIGDAWCSPKQDARGIVPGGGALINPDVPMRAALQKPGTFLLLEIISAIRGDGSAEELPDLAEPGAALRGIR